MSTLEAAPPSDVQVTPPSSAMRVAILTMVVLPPLCFACAVVMLWGVAFSWTQLALFVVMYLGTGLGITVGYHRLFTHRSFDAPAPVRFVFGMLGSMAIQGPLLKWVADHRVHHQHSDHDQDPHSPHLHGEGINGLAQGFWHSHVGWLFSGERLDLYRYVGDLQRDRVASIISRWFILWAALGLAIPAVLAGLITWSWMGLILGLLWAGFGRVFLVHHLTWSINSVCHLWGFRPFRTADQSRNNLALGILALGEGWHNNHHAFPTSARHGLRWWEFDVSYLIIRLLWLVGLARDVKVPDRAVITRKRTN